jgi:hypothetical protein
MSAPMRTPVKHRFADMLLQDRIRFGFSVLLLLLFTYTAYESWGFVPLARYLPFSASVVAIGMMIFSISVDIATFRRTGRVSADDVSSTSSMAVAVEQEDALHAAEEGTGAAVDEAFKGPKTQADAIRGSFFVFLWILGYVVGIAVVGLLLATTLYLVLYLWREAKASWRLNIIGNLSILLLLNIMREALNLQWPPYLLRDTFDSVFAPLYRFGDDLLDLLTRGMF